MNLPEDDPHKVPPKRRPGGQPGNRNAYKYGLYSRFFTEEEKKSLEVGIQGELKDEEALLNILIRRTLESIRRSDLSWVEFVVALRAVSQAIGRKESLHRSRKAVYEAETTISKAIEELKYIPLEED